MTTSPKGWAFGAERTRPEPRKRAEWLRNPRRDEALKPEEVVAALRLEPGQFVADIGSGPGYFTLPFARAVGPAGRVYGVDIEPHFLSELERLAGLSDLSNVVPVLTAPDSPGLPPASVNLAFFCSVYRHIADRADYLRKLRSCLKPGGRIAILEWRKTDTLRGELRLSNKKVGPPEAGKIDPEQVVRELQEAGFTVLEQPEFLDYHFFVIAGLER
jgi:ubiquinone/menaquinone biosynthesis C-methylase UbiE